MIGIRKKVAAAKRLALIGELTSMTERMSQATRDNPERAWPGIPPLTQRARAEAETCDVDLLERAVAEMRAYMAELGVE